MTEGYYVDVNSLFDLSGKRAVVTGGSRGIGQMITVGLLSSGVEVVITSRKEDQLRASAEEMSHLGTVHPVPSDLSDPEQVERFADEVRGVFDHGLDILVNNAGAVWGAPVDEFPVKGFDKVLDINVRAPFLLTQALLPELRAAATEDDPARVVNVGSVDGIRTPVMDNFSYSASKAAVHQMTRHLATKLVGDHVSVNAIAPGPFESRMMAFALEDPESRAAVEAGVPMGRIGTPEDVAGTVIYLCSRAGAYLTGAIVPVDGGITAR